MATFDCNWCGKCCQSFGEFIGIERQINGRDYYIRYGITNELFPVHVQPEFADEIEEDFINARVKTEIGDFSEDDMKSLLENAQAILTDKLLKEE